MFEKFVFTPKQIEKYFESALRDFNIAKKGEPEVAFMFYYNGLLKLAITVCAHSGWRVKASRGHHVALIEKFSKLLNNSEVELIGQKMRAKRNKDIYGAGVLITKKEIDMYREFITDLVDQVEKYLDFNKLF